MNATSTKYMRQAAALFGFAALVLILVGATAFAQGSHQPSRGDAAWAQRLTTEYQQLVAEQARTERAETAWAARLTAQAGAIRQEEARAERANAAESLRLTKLAEYLLPAGPSDRANKAWSDRLTGLAEAEAASK
jgi:hypothetical protein